MYLNQLPNGSYVDQDDPGESCYSAGLPRVSVTEEEARWLSWLATGRRALEIGTGIGVSTRALAKTASYVTTVDPDLWVQSDVWPRLRQLGNVETLHDVPEHGQFDLVFIDGNHSSHSVLADIRATRPLCHAAGLIVLHDMIYASVREAVLGLCPTVRTIDTTHGLGLIWASAL